jgi:hypothetical protein
MMSKYGLFGFQLGVVSFAVHQSHVQRSKVFFRQLHEEPVAAAPAPAMAFDATNEPLAVNLF